MNIIGTFYLDWTDINPTLKIQGKDDLIKRLAATYGKVGQATELSATFAKVLPGKSNPQLGYFHKVILPLAVIGFRDAGYVHITEFDVYDALKDMFFFKSVFNEITGQMIKVEKSMADATIEEAAKFITDCINFIETEFSIPVPEPTKKQ